MAKTQKSGLVKLCDFLLRGEQGKSAVVTGRDTACNEFAPSVATSCGGRGNILWRTCEVLSAIVERQAFIVYLKKGVKGYPFCPYVERTYKGTKKLGKMQVKMSFICINLAFYSLIRTFAPKLIRYGKKKMALQGWATAYGT